MFATYWVEVEMKRWLKKTWVKMGLSILIGLVFGFLVSEVSFRLTPDLNQLEPDRIEVVIPAGTAAKLAAGQAVAVPEEILFVIGDLLVVKNEDSVSHQLGPVWVPAQSSGVLQIGSDEKSITYQCTFTTSRSFGLDVQPAIDFWVRFQGILSVGLPTGVMLALYTLAVPSKPEELKAEDARS
jgi:hypothetical protein